LLPGRSIHITVSTVLTPAFVCDALYRVTGRSYPLGTSRRKLPPPNSGYELLVITVDRRGEYQP
jgi:hypothetical protein